MSEASARVNKAAEDARSGDDPVSSPMDIGLWAEPPLDSPLDRETLDESASKQLGRWDSRRRDTD